MVDKLRLRDWQQMCLAKSVHCAGTPESNQYLAESRRYGAAADRIDLLEAENSALKNPKPARRAEKNTEPVKAIGPFNEAYWFGAEAKCT